MIDSHSTGAVLVIVLSGEVDMAVAPSLMAALSSATQESWQVIAVDCENLDFIDVAGARPIARARREAAKRGIRFYLLRPSPAVTRVFEFFELCERIIPRRQTALFGFEDVQSIESSAARR